MQNFDFHRGWLTLLISLALTACGFHMRGTGSMPFETLYVQNSGAPGIARDLKRALSSSGVKLVAHPEDAQASMELMNESSDKRILSLSGKGKVREYEILYHVVFRLREAGVELWGEPQAVDLRRDFSYSDSAMLAKEAEETRLANDMRAEAVREIMRRVGSQIKPKATTE
jgi:LPS-assembly lipoprotein